MASLSVSRSGVSVQRLFCSQVLGAALAGLVGDGGNAELERGRKRVVCMMLARLGFFYFGRFTG